jgi:transposase-like protein
MRTHSSTPSTKADGFRRIEVITGVGRRRRWTDEEKAWIVAESLDPATTVSAVARRYGCTRASCSPGASSSRHRRRARLPSSCRCWLAEDGPDTRPRCGPDGDRARPGVVRVGADVDAAALRRVLEVVRGLA